LFHLEEAFTGLVLGGEGYYVPIGFFPCTKYSPLAPED